MFYFSKKVRLFSQNDVLFLFYFLINPAGTTVLVKTLPCRNYVADGKINRYLAITRMFSFEPVSLNSNRLSLASICVDVYSLMLEIHLVRKFFFSIGNLIRLHLLRAQFFSIKLHTAHRRRLKQWRIQVDPVQPR